MAKPESSSQSNSQSIAASLFQIATSLAQLVVTARRVESKLDALATNQLVLGQKIDALALVIGDPGSADPDPSQPLVDDETAQLADSLDRLEADINALK